MVSIEIKLAISDSPFVSKAAKCGLDLGSKHTYPCNTRHIRRQNSFKKIKPRPETPERG